MWFRTATFLAFVVILAAPNVLYAAEEAKPFKYAYVNMERVMDEYVLFAEAKKEAEQKIKDAQLEDTEKLSEYQAKIDELEEKLSGPLTAEAKADATAAYKAGYQEALDFRNDVIAKYKRIERDAFEPVYKKVYEKIESYAIKNDYEVVFDYSAILLYADEESDITEEIIKELNEEAGISK